MRSDMKICKNHWEQLKDAIKVRGLWDLVAPNGQAAIYRMQQELAGTATDSNYDPLMTANYMISGQALNFGGIYLLTGDYCPLCEAEHHTQIPDDFPEEIKKQGVAMYWINGCTDSILDYCREHGLAPKPGETSI